MVLQVVLIGSLKKKAEKDAKDAKEAAELKAARLAFIAKIEKHIEASVTLTDAGKKEEIDKLKTVLTVKEFKSIINKGSKDTRESLLKELKELCLSLPFNAFDMGSVDKECVKK